MIQTEESFRILEFGHRPQDSELPADGLNLERYVENLQKGFPEEALRRSNGVQTKAAQLLRMTYRSFRHYLQKHSISS